MASACIKKHNKRKTITYSDPGKIMDLVLSLTDDSCASLQIKINQYLVDECEAELALHVVVQQSDRREAYIEVVGKYALPRKNKINMTPHLDDVMNSQIEQAELISTFGADFKAIVFPFISKETKEAKSRFVLFPIVERQFSLIVCVLQPKIMEENVASVIYETFLFAWPVVKKAIAFEYECQLKEKCQQLLKVARRLFTKVASLDNLLLIMMEQAKSLTKAEYCSVKIVDPDRMELVEQFTPGKGTTFQREERRFPINLGIAGYVVKSGTVVNSQNESAHPAYNEEIDSIPGVNCKTLLCFPIREQSGIIGVGSLINKIGDPYFDSMDEEMALAFSIYCGVCIVHSVVYKRVQEAHVRNALANELIMYHMKVNESEITRLLECTGFHEHPHVATLHFNPRALPIRELPCYVFKMFSDLGFAQKYNLKPAKLASFILHVKRGYRDVPYHSWMHAFNVAQWAYAAMINFKLISQGYLSELQGFMYLVAGLVHDLDHRGTTNSFHLQGQTTLAALYSSEGSVMERHHLAQAMSIINTEGCDVLEPLSRRDYDRALLMLRDYLLASDLANYFKNIAEYKIIAQDFQKGNKVHIAALQALLMNAADLSDQLKDWGSVKKTAAAVLTEFFRQGDMEKSRGDAPLEVMDREKCFIPSLEIQFLENTCIPLFDTLSQILPKGQPSVKILENHIERWDAARPIFQEVPMSAGLSVLLSPDLDNLIEANILEKERLRKEAEEAAAAAAAEEAAELAAAAEAQNK